MVAMLRIPFFHSGNFSTGPGLILYKVCTGAIFQCKNLFESDLRWKKKRKNLETQAFLIIKLVPVLIKMQILDPDFLKSRIWNRCELHPQQQQGTTVLTCLRNLLAIIMNLSIRQRSMPNHSRPIVTKKHFMKSRAAFTLPKQSDIGKPTWHSV